jgi:hypothetical protein
MPTLRLSLSGLCTFVFDPPLQETGATSRKLTILLQRLTRARPLSNRVNLQPEVLDQHFPLLDFNLRDLQEGSRKADFHCFPDAAGRMTRGVCLLNGEDLSILVDGVKTEGRPLTFSLAEPANLDNPSPLEQESLFWMAALEDARPGAALDRRLFETAPGSNQPILARVQVTEGRLKTRELTDLPFTVAGSVGATRLNRRIATAFELEMHFEKTVKIEMVANRNGRTTRSSLVLAPAGGGDLEAGIANMEIDRFIGMDPASGPRVEADFEVYSDLLANPPGRGEPRPFLRQAGAGISSGQGLSGCAPMVGSVQVGG